MNILVVEDDKELGKNLAGILNEELYGVKIANCAAKAIELLEAKIFDLVVLDINLPDMSGLELLGHMRSVMKLKTQVLILSSNSEIGDKIEALDGGADDYITKPFSVIEFLARVRALLRRVSSQKDTKLVVSDIEIDIAAHTVKKGGENIQLTPKEFSILELFFYNRSIILTPLQIAEHIYDDYVEKSSHIINMHIRNIGVKLSSPDIIETVRGIGFRLGK